MPIDNTLALQIRPLEFDLGRTLGQVAQLKRAQTESELGQLKLLQANEQRGALQNFRDTGQLDALKAHPELYGSVLQNQGLAQRNQTGLEADKRERNARDAQYVMSIPDGPAQDAAYLERITAAGKDGRAPALMVQQMIGLRGDERKRALQGIIAQGMPLQATETPKFQKVGEEVDRYGAKRDSYGFVDPIHQRVIPHNPSGDSPKTSSLDGLEGRALLDALDPGERANIMAYLEGRRAPPPANPRVPATMRAWDILGRVDPGFDMTTWKTRNETEAAYSKGMEGRNITALNTLPRHLQELYQAADDLKNSNLWGTNLLRHITNPIVGLSSNVEARFKRFENAKQAVAEELGKAFHGAAAVSATEGWKGQFSATSSDEALKASILEAIKLATGRTEELEASYKRSMRIPPDKALDRPFISPSARKAFDEVAAKVKGVKTGNPEKLPRLTGTQAEQNAQYEALNPGEKFIDANGKPWAKPGTFRKPTGRLRPDVEPGDQIYEPQPDGSVKRVR